MPAQSLGLDFGTTNTVATTIDEHGETRAYRARGLSAFRSVLCFWPGEDEHARAHLEAGPWAIDQFVERGGDCRFIQSFKTFAASPLFTDTMIYGRRFTFEDLLGAFLRKMSEHTQADFPRRAVIGRPVRFAGVSPDEDLARTRYEKALRAVGFEEIHHVYEPVAAAYFYAQRLKSEATILVADFGGGTSDFSIVRFSPSTDGLRFEPLAQSGVGVAGDAFDYRIVDRAVAPFFGKGSQYRSWDKFLPMPDGYYSRFARWNELSIMKHTREFQDLKRLAKDAVEPEKVEAFIAFLEADAGYAMNRAVTDLKQQLSTAEEGVLSLHAPGVSLERTIKRASFERWIAPELEKISASVSEALANAGLGEARVDKVFLTGGSSFVPALRRQFEARFGAGKIETGDQLVSIAYGLALIAQEDDVTRWAA